MAHQAGLGVASLLFEAIIGFGGAALFVILVAVLHLLKPDLKPSSHMISEYAIGHNGWMMQTAFYALTVSCLALAFGLWPYAPGARIGLVLLAIAGIGAAGAGYFVTDPLETSREAGTSSGLLHVVFSFVLIPIFPLAATLIASSLDNSGQCGPLLLWLSASVWVGFLGFLGAPMLLTRLGNHAVSAVPFGYFQRFMVLTYATWLMAFAMIAYHLPFHR